MIKKYVFVTMLILACFVLSSCSYIKQSPLNVPSITQSNSVFPSPLDTKPVPSALIIQPTEIATTEKEQIPLDVQKQIFGMGPNDSSKDDRYNKYFQWNCMADLDGDAKNEDIRLKFKDKKHYYISVVINNKEISMEYKGFRRDDVSDGDVLRLDGYIIDILKNDGKKEIAIPCYDLHSVGYYYIVTYDNREPKIILAHEACSDPFATGTGLMVGSRAAGKDYWETIKIPLRLRSDRSGFDEIPLSLYFTQFTYMPSDTDKDPGVTQWDEKIAAQPNGTENIPVPAGTGIFFGRYDLSGWYEVYGADGELLGFLNDKRLDFEQYVDYAFSFD